MPELKLVRTFDQIQDDVIRDLRTNWKSIRDLERKHGLSRNIIVSLQKQYDRHEKNRNIVKIPRSRQKIVEAPKLGLHLVTTMANASLVCITALMLGGVGMYFNIQYWFAYGGTPFGVLGGAIDGVTIFLPGILACRWKHAPLYMVWLLCAGLSTIAALGFAAQNIGDSLQVRDSIVQHRNALNAELNRIRAERVEITEDRVRVSKRWTEHRIELDNKLHQLAEDIAKLPPIAGKDLAADGVSQLSGGNITSSMVEQFRVLGFAFMPSLAGFLLAFARTLIMK